MLLPFVWLNGIIFAVCLPYLGIPLWKAAIVALIAALCTFLHYGGRWVSRIGFATLAVTLATWIGFLPATQEWPAHLRTLTNLTGHAGPTDHAQQQIPSPESTGALR
jgi:hypothetical protein